MADNDPGQDFAQPLRDWFVDEVGRPLDGDPTLRREPPSGGALVPHSEPEAGRPGRHRRLMVLVNAAAVLALVIGLVLMRSANDDPAPAEPADDVASTIVRVEAAATVEEVCDQYRDRSATELPMGASEARVIDAATDVRGRLMTARDQLLALEPTTFDELQRPIELAEEAIRAAEQLAAVAGGERRGVDVAVENVDLIVAAWARELAEVTEEGCEDLPTLRGLQ